MKNETTADASRRDWFVARERIHSRTGKWRAGQGVEVRGLSLFSDVVGKLSYMQLMVLNITGRVIADNLAVWLENNFMGVSYPDSRIWCNQLGAIAGTQSATPVAALAAGCLGADSRAYGGSQTTMMAMAFLEQMKARTDAGEPIERLLGELEIKQGRPAITGFARPIDAQDERIEPFQALSHELGFAPGAYMRLAERISALLEKDFATGMNVGGFTAAFLLDQGFSPDEAYRVFALCVASGVAASYVDNIHRPSQSYLPLLCEDVDYHGCRPREIPD